MAAPIGVVMSSQRSISFRGGLTVARRFDVSSPLCKLTIDARRLRFEAVWFIELTIDKHARRSIQSIDGWMHSGVWFERGPDQRPLVFWTGDREDVVAALREHGDEVADSLSPEVKRSIQWLGWLRAARRAQPPVDTGAATVGSNRPPRDRRQ